MMNFSFMSELMFEEIINGSIDFVVKPRDNEGYHMMVGYPNGFSVSVDKLGDGHGYDDALWELALCYDDAFRFDAPIASFVVGYLKDHEVIGYCDRVRELSEDDLRLDYDPNEYRSELYGYSKTSEDEYD